MPENSQARSRTIAIGDIHGHIKALVGLIDLINPQSEDQLVFWVITLIVAQTAKGFCNS